MKPGTFGRIFGFALLGGALYELCLYLFDGSIPHWKNVIIQVVLIALIVTVVMMGIRKIFNQKSETEP